MNKTTLFIIALIALYACRQVNVRPKQEEEAKESVIEPVKPYSNPALIYGSSFGVYMQTLYRQNQFDALLDFTAKGTVRKFGKEKLLKFYRNNFRFDYKLGALTNAITNGDTITLTYANACVMATRRKQIIKCVVENDSCRLIIYSINSKKNNFFFTE